MGQSRSLLLTVLLVVLALAGAIVWLNLPDPEGQQTDDAVVATDAAQAVAREGVAELDLTVTAKMPPDFDDGVPSREFVGDGVADFSDNLASVDFALGEVPNSAGYFGHVEGDLSVVYQDERFIITFPLMADVLDGELDWMSYELSDFLAPDVLDRGIGQLREVGLADPRLGFALVSAGLRDDPEAEGEVLVDITQPSDVVGPELQPVIQELRNLGVTQVDLAMEVDEDGLLESYSYDLAYPPNGVGGPKARLSVTVEISGVGAGVAESVEVPPESTVKRYLDYLGA